MVAVHVEYVGYIPLRAVNLWKQKFVLRSDTLVKLNDMIKMDEHKWALVPNAYHAIKCFLSEKKNGN